MSKVIEKSPTRIDFCGGFLDIYPIYLFFDKVNVINASIDLLTSCEITESDSLTLISKDLNIEENYFDSRKNHQSQLPFHQKLVEVFNLENEKIILQTNSQVPKGSGLGGSSSLIVSMVNAVNNFKNLKLSKPDILTVSQNIETSILKVPTGTQDYLAAQNEGVNHFLYNPKSIDRVQLDLYDNKFIQYFLEHVNLIYLGKSHFSANENWYIYQKVITKESKTLKLLRELKMVSDRITSSFQEKELDQLFELINTEWMLRRQLIPNMESKQMTYVKEALENQKINFGTKGCGAGAGGSMIVFSNPEDKSEVKSLINNTNSRYLDFNLYKK